MEAGKRGQLEVIILTNRGERDCLRSEREVITLEEKREEKRWSQTVWEIRKSNTDAT